MSPAAIACCASITALRSRAADLVNGQGGHVIRKASTERRLTGRRLSGSRGDDVAHDAFLDAGGVDSGPADGLSHHQRAQVGRGQILQRSKEFAGRRANG